MPILNDNSTQRRRGAKKNGFFSPSLRHWVSAFIFLICSFSLHAEMEIVPVNAAGRFRPYEVVEKGDDSNLKMLPSKWHPEIWLPLAKLKEEGPNPTLFSDDVWRKLKGTKDPEEFARNYLAAYKLLSHPNFPSISQLKAEIFFYRWPLVNYAIAAYIGAALFFFLAEGLQKRFLKYLAWICFSTAFSIHTLMLVLRSYILMRPPVSGMAETVIYVPWIAALLAAFLSRKTYLPIAAGSALAASLLAILQWTFTASSLEPVQAVLNSQLWLTIHVLMIVASYGALILGGVLGHIALIKPNAKLTATLLQSLYIGTALLIPGTILGGVWAAQSWGRFWDWDPKESWAFISSCVYLLVIHAYRFGKIDSKGLAIGSIFGLLAISFTWYGVNYILGKGLHSYGFGSGGEWIYLSYVLLELMFIAIFAIALPQEPTRNSNDEPF